MKNSDRVIRSAVLSVLALGVATMSSASLAAKGDNEKCAGIVKAGKNDCGTSYSSCAGTAKADADKEAWIYLPKGACEKIVGGSITTSAHAQPGGKK
ncbi:MAG: BufA1 family periplasmic bufferin-type metallophore [Burkholderiales bacterium]